ncbi:MAG: FGGY-family carbohydrate kinase [Burkholderiales bacterium]|nr:FGGY-family carbohydrate kinase [Anaerolineae bacterium]
MEQLFLGIDVGTTAAKAALFSADGRLWAVGQGEYSVQHVRPNWVEQRPEDWWQAVCSAIRQALAAVPDGAQRVAGVAVSAQAPTLIALDRSGQPLRPALIWMDRRAEEEVSRLNEALGADNIYRITGNRTDAFYVAAKLLWFKTHEPELLAQTHQFVQINGYINYRLTNTYSLDPVHAALLQLRDYATGEWWTEICDICGVEPSQFPEVRPGHEIHGEVTPYAAAATGLRPGTPVVVGTVDGAAAALEAGAIEPGSAAEMTGTSTVLLMPKAGSVTEAAFIAMPHAVPDVHLLLGAMVASGASLRWFRDQFGAVEKQAGAQLSIDPFDLLTQQAAQVEAGSDGVIFLPYMMGERAPLWHTQARGVFFGLSLATPKAALIRAILEGTAFALRHNVEVARNAGVELSELRSVGGGTRSALWNQIKADVLGVPVLLPKASVGAPFGDAILVGIGVGAYPEVGLSDALRDIIKLQTRYEPNPQNHERYQQIYPIFRSVYEHLRGDFDTMAAVFNSSSES